MVCGMGADRGTANIPAILLSYMDYLGLAMRMALMRLSRSGAIMPCRSGVLVWVPTVVTVGTVGTTGVCVVTGGGGTGGADWAVVAGASMPAVW